MVLGLFLIFCMQDLWGAKHPVQDMQQRGKYSFDIIQIIIYDSHVRIT